MRDEELREFSVLCPAGFEQVLADELKVLGCKRVRPLRGSVAFFGALRDGYRVCLWSRLASRVVLVAERLACDSVEDLYAECLGVRWEEHIGEGATIAVETRGGSRRIRDLRFCSLKVKDAVCDRLREVRGSRPSVDADRPDVLVAVTVREGKATLGIDLGGSSLIDHGYRVPARDRSVAGRSSFVREDMAALLLALGGWQKLCRRSDRARLFDPLGTSPALAVEAACVACDRAPRLSKRRWGFTGWAGHDAEAWAEVLREAESRFEEGRRSGGLVTVAALDAGVRKEISEMAARTGVSGALSVRPRSLTEADLGAARVPDSVVVCAVPDDAAAVNGDLPARLAALAALTRSEALSESPVAALCTGDMLTYALGIGPDLGCHVVNGREDADVLVYPSAAQEARRAASEGREPGSPHRARPSDADSGDPFDPGPRDPEGPCRDSGDASHAPAEAASAEARQIELPGGRRLAVLVPTSDQFAARLAKVAKQRAKWASRNGITCYRVYDADLPDYAVTVDLYTGCAATPGKWVVMSEYAAPGSVDPDIARRRLSDALAIAPRVLGVSPDDVFLKVRRREKGGSQYAGRGGQGRVALVEEGGLVFEVNLSDYLDTGLFLDHRIVRSMIRDMAPRTRFLNLFAYTGTASCYAADGGAYQTTTVDLSNTYLAWARRNMEQNGFGGRSHEFVQADVMPWIAETRHTGMRWDLIYIDPPTFSNSARMRKRGFGVQEDHVELLIGASRLLVRGGTIVFSCNLRGFSPDVAALAKAGVSIEDVTEGTIPEDFARNAKVHHCYLVRRSD